MSDNYQSIKRDGNIKSEIDFPTLYFTNSVKNVINTMTGMEANEVSSQGGNDEDFPSQVTGIVLLTGERNMMISLTMSKNMGTAMVSFMTGMQPEELHDEEVCDGIAELVHMIAGETKAQLKSRNYHFVSLPPFAVFGDRHQLFHRNKVIHIIKRFRVEEVDMLLKVYII